MGVYEEWDIYIWAQVYISVRRSHMKSWCPLSIIWLWRVCLCAKQAGFCASVAHLSQSTCPLQPYTYTYKTMCLRQLSRGEREYRPAFCIDWQVWPQTVPPPQLFRTCVQNLLWASTLIWAFLKKSTHTPHPCASVTQKCQCMTRSLATCVSVPQHVYAVVHPKQ